MKKAIIKSLATGMKIEVHATTEHPASSYGKPVWVDNKGYAYGQVGTELPFYEITELNDSGEKENRLS